MLRAVVAVAEGEEVLEEEEEDEDMVRSLRVLWKTVLTLAM